MWMGVSPRQPFFSLEFLKYVFMLNVCKGLFACCGNLQELEAGLLLEP